MAVNFPYTDRQLFGHTHTLMHHMLIVWFLNLVLLTMLGGVAYCLWMAAYALTHRHIRGARMLGLMMLALTGWLGFVPVFMLSPTAETARFVETYLRYACISLFPILFVGFTLEYTARTRLLRLWLACGWIVPAINHAIHWIDPTWMLTSMDISQIGPYWMTQTFSAGPGYTLMTVTMYAMFALGIIVLIQRFRFAPQLNRLQIRALIIACSIPLWVNLIFIGRIVPLPELDWAALSFPLTAFLLTRALIRYRLFNLTPIAHETIVQNMDEAVIVVDLDNRVIQLNPAAERLTQRQSRELVGKHIDIAFKDQCPLVEGMIAAQNGTSEITMGDPPQYFEIKLSAITHLGAPIGRMGIVRDISARKQQELERERFISELDAFAHTAAHDLKSPLGVITGYIGLLEGGWNTLPQDRADLYLHTIAAYSRKMALIVDDLLLLARTRSAEDLPLMPMDARSVARASIERLETQIAETQADIQFAGEAWPLVVGYVPWIEEVWANYISNAIKYGGTPPQVTIGCDRLPSPQEARPMIRFWVRDNGAGLTDEQQARLFKQFTRLEPTRATGTGLGLTIARRIVERLNSAVGVISAPGQGSTFTFTLPEAVDPAPQIAQVHTLETVSGV